MEFKDILKTLRIEKGLTQTELANLINSRQGTIHAWESGRTDVTGFYLLKLSKILNASTDELLGLESLPPRTDVANQALGLLNNMSEEQQEFCLEFINLVYQNKNNKNLFK
jgi:transcriptional regulator with XRE-family HTH domain